MTLPTFYFLILERGGVGFGRSGWVRGIGGRRERGVKIRKKEPSNAGYFSK